MAGIIKEVSDSSAALHANTGAEVEKKYFPLNGETDSATRRPRSFFSLVDYKDERKAPPSLHPLHAFRSKNASNVTVNLRWSKV